MLALGHRRHRQLSLLRGPIGLSGHVCHTSKHRVIGITGSALGYVATRHPHKRRLCETPRPRWPQTGSTFGYASPCCLALLMRLPRSREGLRTSGGQTPALGAGFCSVHRPGSVPRMDPEPRANSPLFAVSISRQSETMTTTTTQYGDDQRSGRPRRSSPPTPDTTQGSNRHRSTWPLCRPTASTGSPTTPPTPRSSTTKPTPPQPARQFATSVASIRTSQPLPPK